MDLVTLIQQYDYGNGDNWKLQTNNNPPIALHAFTGNDYVSSFLRKSKKRYWEVVIKNPLFLVTFAKLGDDWNLEEQFFNTRSLCCLFGSKKKSIDIVWPDMLMKKINVKTKWLVYQICHYYIHAISNIVHCSCICSAHSYRKDLEV